MIFSQKAGSGEHSRPRCWSRCSVDAGQATEVALTTLIDAMPQIVWICDAVGGNEIANWRGGARRSPARRAPRTSSSRR